MKSTDPFRGIIFIKSEETTKIEEKRRRIRGYGYGVYLEKRENRLMDRTEVIGKQAPSTARVVSGKLFYKIGVRLRKKKQKKKQSGKRQLGSVGLVERE